MEIFKEVKNYNNCVNNIEIVMTFTFNNILDMSFNILNDKQLYYLTESLKIIDVKKLHINKIYVNNENIVYNEMLADLFKIDVSNIIVIN